MTLLIENAQPPFYSITIIQQRKRCWIPYSRVTNDSDLSLKIEKHNQWSYQEWWTQLGKGKSKTKKQVIKLTSHLPITITYQQKDLVLEKKSNMRLDSLVISPFQIAPS